MAQSTILPVFPRCCHWMLLHVFPRRCHWARVFWAFSLLIVLRWCKIKLIAQSIKYQTFGNCSLSYYGHHPRKGRTWIAMGKRSRTKTLSKLKSRLDRTTQGKMATRKPSAIEGSEKSKTPFGWVMQHSLIVGGALHNFACFPKALPLAVVSSFPKALPLG